MEQKTKKAILIGETNLCTQCAKHLIDKNWEIISIVSYDYTVINWAKDNSILTIELNAVAQLPQTISPNQTKSP